MFKKKAKNQAKNQADSVDNQADSVEEAAPGQSGEESGQPSELPPAEPAVLDRSEGPFDASEVEDVDEFLDFGCLLVPNRSDVVVRMEQDSGSGRVTSLTLVLGGAAVQCRVLAAPRSGGLWEQSREAISGQITSGGGRAEEAEGPFGAELHADVTVDADQPGGPGLRPMRFVGVEGPRWLLHGAFMGQGARSSTSAAIDELFRSLVVVRGEEAMPVGALVLLRPPAQVEAPTEQAEGEPAPTLESLEPGDRISEVR